MGPQRSGNHRQVGLGAPHQEMDRQSIVLADSPYFRRGSGAVAIRAVTAGLLQIGLGQSLQDLRMAAFRIVVVEINHGIHPLYCIFSPILFPDSPPVKGIDWAGTA